MRMPKVMIVDDDRITVSLLETLLRMDGFEVVTEARRDLILPGIRSAAPDLVLMDVFLAQSDGMGVLADLRSAPDLKGLRVVMTSGMDLEEQCLAAGANAFLLKPYTPDQLSKVIQENLGADGGEPAGAARQQE
jgi:CheY-like chemotaxis protein